MYLQYKMHCKKRRIWKLVMPTKLTRRAPSCIAEDNSSFVSKMRQKFTSFCCYPYFLLLQIHYKCWNIDPQNATFFPKLIFRSLYWDSCERNLVLAYLVLKVWHFRVNKMYTGWFFLVALILLSPKPLKIQNGLNGENCAYFFLIISGNENKLFF